MSSESEQENAQHICYVFKNFFGQLGIFFCVNLGLLGPKAWEFAKKSGSTERKQLINGGANMKVVYGDLLDN